MPANKKSKFVLPRGWYRQTITDLVETVLPPLLGPLTDETAWRYVYAVSMFPVTVDGNDYIHLVETSSLKSQRWRNFADRGADYLKSQLTAESTCQPFDVIDHIGRAYTAERAAQGHGPKGRDPNTTGNSFEAVLQALIDKQCGVKASRTPLLRSLRGFELAPVAYHSRPDLVLFGPRDFRLLISMKWTLRKERIGTYLHESYFYKQRRPDLQVAFVVSDFQPSILRHLSTDPLVDRVYHVNKKLLLHLHDPLPPGDDVPRDLVSGPSKNAAAFRQWLGLENRLFDLTDLFTDIRRLRDLPEVVLDPEDGVEGEDEDAL